MMNVLSEIFIYYIGGVFVSISFLLGWKHHEAEKQRRFLEYIEKTTKLDMKREFERLERNIFTVPLLKTCLMVLGPCTGIVLWVLNTVKAILIAS